MKNLVEHNAERVFAKQPMENFNVVLRALAGPTLRSWWDAGTDPEFTPTFRSRNQRLGEPLAPASVSPHPLYDILVLTLHS